MTEQGREVLAAAGQSVRSLCKRAWWVFLIGGIASVVFGVLAFINPGIALLVLGMFFAASILVDGAVNAWGALQNREKDGWWAILLIGLAGILVGGYALFNPPVSMMALIFLVAVMAVVIGVGLLVLGYKIRADICYELFDNPAGLRPCLQEAGRGLPAAIVRREPLRIADRPAVTLVANETPHRVPRVGAQGRYGGGIEVRVTFRYGEKRPNLDCSAQGHQTLV